MTRMSSTEPKAMTKSFEVNVSVDCGTTSGFVRSTIGREPFRGDQNRIVTWTGRIIQSHGKIRSSSDRMLQRFTNCTTLVPFLCLPIPPSRSHPTTACPHSTCYPVGTVSSLVRPPLAEHVSRQTCSRPARCTRPDRLTGSVDAILERQAEICRASESRRGDWTASTRGSLMTALSSRKTNPDWSTWRRGG